VLLLLLLALTRTLDEALAEHDLLLLLLQVVALTRRISWSHSRTQHTTSNCTHHCSLACNRGCSCCCHCCCRCCCCGL
jgi:hypothetical protein